MKPLFPLLPVIDDTACIVGLDPGSTNLGYCKLLFSARTGQLKEACPRTITGNRALGLDPTHIATHGERFARIQAICNELLRSFYQDMPLYIVCESPFFNPRMPNAHAALQEVLVNIRNTVNAFNPHMRLEEIPPSSAKNAVGASGGAKKEVMQQIVLSMPGINFTGDVPQHMLDEHSIDAFAVAYSRYAQCLRYFV